MPRRRAEVVADGRADFRSTVLEVLLDIRDALLELSKQLRRDARTPEG